MDPELTALEVIGMAIRSEEDAARFYGHIARRIDNDLVREKYRQLAAEEANHRKILVDLYHSLLKTQGSPPRVPGQPQTAEGGPVPQEISGSLEDLLKLAIQREQKAEVFYRDAAQRATDLSGKRILQYLSGVEHGHELMLKSELEAYLRDKDWYTSHEPPSMTHVGP